MQFYLIPGLEAAVRCRWEERKVETKQKPPAKLFGRRENDPSSSRRAASAAWEVAAGTQQEAGGGTAARL